MYKRSAIASSQIIIREMRPWELFYLHKLYDSLSDESKKFFHPGFLGYKDISLRWLASQIALFFSCISFIRKILFTIFPRFVYIPLVAYENRELVGFAYVNVKRTLMKNILLGELGIFVGESHRGKGIGNKLIANLLLFSKKYNVRVVYLTVLSDNVRAIRLYQKYGFKKVGITLDKWKGKTYESIIMKKTF